MLPRALPRTRAALAAAASQPVTVENCKTPIQQGPFVKIDNRSAFQATIQAAGSGGAYVDIPFDVEQRYGKKRVPIVATIDGET